MTDARDVRPAKSFAGQKVHAVAGIGDPKRFFLQLATLRAEARAAPVPGSPSVPAQGTSSSATTRRSLMTEKDAVKCKRFAQAHHWVFPVSASLDPAFGRWLLEKLEWHPKAA